MSGEDDELDRAAILARRRRFVALAISGLAGGGCASAQPCLSVLPPDDPSTQGSDSDGPIVEDEGAPVGGGEGGEGGGEAQGSEDATPEPAPTACLRYAAPDPQPAPQPCLEFAEPPG